MDLLQMFKKEPMWTNRPLKSRYDVVIVGAGVHGLATAYYLTKQGVTDVAVLERSYIGSGGRGPHNAILPPHHPTPPGHPLYALSVTPYPDPSTGPEHTTV